MGVSVGNGSPGASWYVMLLANSSCRARVWVALGLMTPIIFQSMQEPGEAQ
jgi:hypothetical protein